MKAGDQAAQVAAPRAPGPRDQTVEALEPALDQERVVLPLEPAVGPRARDQMVEALEPAPGVRPVEPAPGLRARDQTVVVRGPGLGKATGVRPAEPVPDLRARDRAVRLVGAAGPVLVQGRVVEAAEPVPGLGRAVRAVEPVLGLGRAVRAVEPVPGLGRAVRAVEPVLGLRARVPAVRRPAVTPAPAKPAGLAPARQVAQAGVSRSGSRSNEDAGRGAARHRNRKSHRIDTSFRQTADNRVSGQLFRIGGGP